MNLPNGFISTKKTIKYAIMHETYSNKFLYIFNKI